ncbi:DUF4125 family protein [Bifidobacterium tibiigranuli]|jgi:hypothetical protein|uniref:DUF4125 family protein n=1 Tax=Bifidobacterium tibiigranuli TaxID=2172043 RepID=UPI0026EFB233|nr:DUF4125 family protein [Bifidobacterium tibiigranuli]MCI1650683.1 DUF4125 family protein [Bifidobacterium tibiigranuli]MCI2185190.1 DUF4125 family protein [Bifidobacterium tibiigranuli]MCI2203245.1 DUF4125 family protein [Bifidobacterium tibiigranuli]
MNISEGSVNSDGNELAEAIVRHEWQQFQRTDNEGGRAACQGNWPMFHQMRLSQFLTWPAPLLSSYADDLDEADCLGRNLITEKYGRMMASTAPGEYRRSIEPYIPQLPDARIALQEQVITTQVGWALEFRTRYPKLGNGMRVLRTAEDAPDATSFESYLRGELGTYSSSTFELYRRFIDELQSQGRNLTEETVRNTVLLGGFTSLEEAEALQ